MTREVSSYEQKLWNEYTSNASDEVINKLIQYYMYLVDFHADRIASHLPKNVVKDDIKSFGLLGLYDAINKFEAERNFKFDTYASFRIKGAIIDGLRKEDWLPRSLREKTKKVENAMQHLEQVLERKPSAMEIAVSTGMKEEEVESAVKDSLFSNVLSIEEKPKENNQFNEGIGYSIPDKKTDLPETYIMKEEIKEELMHAIQKLNENERMVVSLFYDKELTLTEIGQVLELTTSRISQIHKKAIFKLRDILNKL